MIGRLGTALYTEKDSINAMQAELKQDLSASADEISKPYISPNGSMFVNPSVRKGILPMMLQEILDTRQMIKRSMKIYSGQEGGEILQRVLDARQLALKLIANGIHSLQLCFKLQHISRIYFSVTYGYTAAGFSGRMPMAELADAVVQSGRRYVI